MTVKIAVNKFSVWLYDISEYQRIKDKLCVENEWDGIETQNEMVLCVVYIVYCRHIRYLGIMKRLTVDFNG